MTTPAYRRCKAEADKLERKIGDVDSKIKLLDRDIAALQHRVNREHYIEERNRHPTEGTRREDIYMMSTIKAKRDAKKALRDDYRNEKQFLRRLLREKLSECRSLASIPIRKNPVVNEAAARKKIADPAYWRDHDPALHEEVQADFEALYPR